MLDNLDVDDSESPAIGIVPAGVRWHDVQDHLRIGRSPLLLPIDDGGQYRGLYWTQAKPIVVGELGTDQEQAISEFREVLRERGEA